MKSNSRGSVLNKTIEGGKPATLDTDFDQLGNLIQQQTQIIVDTVNRDGMALALSSSDVATARIQTFLSNNDPEALEIAESESDLSKPRSLSIPLTGMGWRSRFPALTSPPPESRPF